MTFNLKLFKFTSQDPILTFSDSKFVYKVESIKDSSNIFSLKLSHLHKPSDYEQAINEVNIHAMSSHPNILSLKGYSSSENTDEFGLKIRKFFILLEYHDHNLYNEIKLRRGIGKDFHIKEIIKIFDDIFLALLYLQRKNISYRNISPKNVFLFERFVKLGNFENAFNSIGESVTKIDFFKGDAKYAEPNIVSALLSGNSEVEYNYFKNDVYSLASMILSLFFLNINNKEAETKTIGSKTINEKISEIKNKYGSEGEELAVILEIMLNENPKERPDFIELNEICEKSDFLKRNLSNEIFISSIKESNLNFTNYTPDNKLIIDIKEPLKIEKSLIIEEEKKDIDTSDSLNERDSEQGEEIKEITENSNKYLQKQNIFVSGKGTSYSSNYFGLDRDSNILISDPAIENKFSPEKILAQQNLKKNLMALNLKWVDLNSLKIEKKRPGKIESEGDVFFCSNKTHLSLVVKIIKELNEENLFTILKRYEYINSKISKNVLKLEEYAVEYNSNKTGIFHLYLVFKEKKWDLKYATQNKNFPVADKIFIAKQIASVLQEFNDNKAERIVHGNLKPSNILLDNKNVVFITDFANSETFIEGENLKRSRRLTINYSPPEQFLFKRLELNSDIWSLGIIFCELFFNIVLTAEYILSLGLYDEKRKDSLKIQESFIGEILWKKQVAFLIERMTSFDSVERISLPDIIKELSSIENMLKYPSSLNHLNGKSDCYTDNLNPHQSQQKPAGFLTKQVSCNVFSKEKISTTLLEPKKYFSTPKTFSRKRKLNIKNYK